MLESVHGRDSLLYVYAHYIIPLEGTLAGLRSAVCGLRSADLLLKTASGQSPSVNGVQYCVDIVFRPFKVSVQTLSAYRKALIHTQYWLDSNRNYLHGAACTAATLTF